MGLKFKNLFVTRSFLHRSVGTLKKEIEQEFRFIANQVDQSIEDSESRIVSFLSDTVMKFTDNVVKENYKTIKLQNAVNLFLQRYYGKTKLGDYSTHYISYYYEAICETANLGDYIQSIATEDAIQRCTASPVIFEYVLRSALTDHPGGTCVMQGWYEHRQLTFIPGPDTRPIWIGTHLCSEIRERVKYLLDNSSVQLNDIGCRDKSTLDFCRSLGLNAYFSRCLTLTLPKRNVNESNHASTIYLVDCSDSIVESLPRDIKEGAKRISQRNYKFNNWQNWKLCRHAAEELLAEYKKEAKLIVTTALHCAQPCLAMGIPVVFINPSYDEADRFTSMDGIIPQYTIDDIRESRVDFNIPAPEFEDLKLAILRNLELSLKEKLTDEEILERLKVRTFIEQYNIRS